MAKANARFRNRQKMHSKTDSRYEIPFKDRKSFMGTNIEKWVTEKTYKKYLEWIKRGRPKRT
jgi:hypothetical protein